VRADCSQRWDDLAGYAVGALDAAAVPALEAHLAGCERCSEQLRWLGPAVDAIAGSVEPAQPPPGLRDRVLEVAYAEAGADRRHERRARRRRHRAAWWERARRRIGLSSAPRPAAALAILAVLAAAGLTGLALLGGGAGERTVAVVPAAPGVEASGELVVGEDSGTLTARGLPAPGRDGVYQAWVRRGADLAPSTVFVSARDGSAVVAIPAGLEGADGVLVTREPPGGSVRPTGEPLLRATLG